MKILTFLTLFTYFLSSDSAYVLQPIEGIDGDVSVVEFDYKGNAYVSSYNVSNHFLHKLNPSKEKLWTIDTSARVEQILINTQNDVYLKTFTLLTNISLSILREDTLEIEEIYNNWLIEPIFIDEEDNVYFNTHEGVGLLRPNSTLPILIKNLEEDLNLSEETTIAIDSKGNVYFPVIGESPEFNRSIAVVTKDAKQELEPYANKFILGEDLLVEYVTVDQEDNVWVFTYESASSKITKINNSTMEIISKDAANEVIDVKAVKDRIYVARSFFYEYTSPMIYLTLDGKVEVIPDLEEIKDQVIRSTKIVVDKEGNAYFGSYYSFDKGEIVIVKPNELNNTWIDFSGRVNIYVMVLDENDDLWVNTYGQGIYYLKKGETTPVYVSHPTGDYEDLINGIKVHKKTNEVFVLSKNGLFFVSDDLI